MPRSIDLQRNVGDRPPRGGNINGSAVRCECGTTLTHLSFPARVVFTGGEANEFNCPKCGKVSVIRTVR